MLTAMQTHDDWELMFVCHSAAGVQSNTEASIMMMTMYKSIFLVTLQNSTTPTTGRCWRKSLQYSGSFFFFFVCRLCKEEENFNHKSLKFNRSSQTELNIHQTCVKILCYLIRIKPPHRCSITPSCSVARLTRVPAFNLIIVALIRHLYFLLFCLWPLGLFISLL